MSIKIGVIGSGSWGTAIATLLAQNNKLIEMWAREQAVVDSINNDHENTSFLPDIKLPENIVASSEIESVASGKDVLVMVTPAQHMRTVLMDISYLLNPGTYVILASKGIENGTLKLMHQVAEECMPDAMHKDIFVLSGPTFARELSQKMPSAAVVASHHNDGNQFVQQLLSTEYFRVYRSADIAGVEVGGALKNVFAIAVGICEGLGLGYNSQSALMTRAIAEMTRLVNKMGGNPFTVTGLSGVGDMILTCTGHLSRNRQVGVRLGKGEKIDDILSSMNMVAEGVATSVSAYDLSRKLDVPMPITETVYRVLHNGVDIKEAFKGLMTRSLKEEIYGYGI